MKEPITIQSDSLIDDVDRHFRVTAGPGGGKTYWLVLHIKNVIAKSKRLYPGALVGCISYTNTAVEEIANRLGDAKNRVEVSTIHSFLYRYIVKPYVYLLKDQNGLCLVDYEMMDGHTEHRPKFSLVESWLNDFNPRRKIMMYNTEDRELLYDYLLSLKWTIDSNSNLIIESKQKKRRLSFPDESILAYKKYYWKEGLIDHDDVLCLSYMIIKKYPSICEFLSAKFPYLFVDEFQDTNPIQTKIILEMSKYRSFVGVIGDPEQSIYEFQGANRKDFTDFNSDQCVDYVIPGNRRSSENIIRLINRLRRDKVQQHGLRAFEGSSVCVIADNHQKAIDHVRRSTCNQVIILARKNRNIVELSHPIHNGEEDPWMAFEAADKSRASLFAGLMRAIDLSASGDYGRSVQEIVRVISDNRGRLREPLRLASSKSHITIKILAVYLLRTCFDFEEQLHNASFLEAYSIIGNSLEESKLGVRLTSIRSEKTKDMGSRLSWKLLRHSIDKINPNGDIRTIHQAKGAEFSNVLLYLPLEKNLHWIFSDIEEDDEERRVLYVAVSRAKDNLWICVPKVSKEFRKRLEGIGVKVITIPNQPTLFDDLPAI